VSGPSDLNESLLARLTRSFDTVRTIRFDESGSVLAANDAFARDFGTTPDRLRSARMRDLLTEDDADDLDRWLREGIPVDPVVMNFSWDASSPHSLRCLLERRDDVVMLFGEPMVDIEGAASARMLALNNELAVLSRENTRRRRELERTLKELETSYYHLRKIQEILPLCMGCGKIKTDSTSWKSLAEYLKDNGIFVSHGYCPSCAETYEREHGLGKTS